MKKLLIAVVAMLAVGVPRADAAPKVKSVSNDGGKTTVVVYDDNAGETCSMSGARLLTRKKSVDAKEAWCELSNGIATFVLTFPFLKDFTDGRVEMTINDRNVTLPLPSYPDTVSSLTEPTDPTSEP